MDTLAQQIDILQVKEDPKTEAFEGSILVSSHPLGAPKVEFNEPEQRSEANKTPVPPSSDLPATATCPFTGHSSPSPNSSSTSTLVETSQEIDPELIKTSLEDRVRYLRDFLDFRARDAEMIKKLGPLVFPLIPKIVDGMYFKLFEFDITKQVFLKRNEGFDGPLPSRLEDLTVDSPQLIYRKIFLKSWARRVMTMDYSSIKSYEYLDKVGIMHTGVKPWKHRSNDKPLHVAYRDIGLSLGWVQTVLQTAILQLPEDQLSASEKVETVAAINKVMWLQNDLFARHYINE